MSLNLYFCFQFKHQAFLLLSDFILTVRIPFFRRFPSSPPSSSLQTPSRPSQKLTLVYPLRIRNLNALAYSGKMYYLCVEMAGKGLISRMSDECLITLETVFLFYIDCQAVMRKFILASKTNITVFILILYCLFVLTGSIELHRCATTCAVRILLL